MKRPSFAIASVMRRVLSSVVYFLCDDVVSLESAEDEEEETVIGVSHGNISDRGWVVDVSIVATMIMEDEWRRSEEDHSRL